MNQYQSIMMVDDDDATNFLHKRIINKMNLAAEVKVFNESSHALSYLEKPGTVSPDLMFLDLNMPEMPGWEILEKLSSRHKNSIPIIILSTYICVEKKKKFRRSGYKIAFVEKPLSVNKLDVALTQM